MPTPTYTLPLAVQWNRYACDALYLTNTPPTIASRALAIVHMAMYDALTLFLPGKETATTRWYGVSDPYHYLRVFGRTSMHTYPKKAEVK